MAYPADRPRRLRSSERLRDLVAETDRLAPSRLVYPLFAREGLGERRPIPSMPGCAQLSVDLLVDEARRAQDEGIGAVLLFGIPDRKDALGSSGRDPDGLVPRALRALAEKAPEIVLIADVCLCEYTDHGHCGALDERGGVANDETLPLLAEAAVACARAGAHVVAPSDMMDGRVGHIRTALDSNGRTDVAILSYAAKYASAFYGPFREAAQSAPRSGDRRGYQMDPRNAREAVREVRLDDAEGADVLMVKPGLAYLDVLARARAATAKPLAVYNVSGEHALVEAASEKGWIDRRRTILEIMTAFRRAGADVVITYWAREIARWSR